MADINEVGATAFFIAGIREQEKDREHPLFNDPYAQWFVNDDIREKVRQVFAVLPEGMELVRYRSCLFDDITRREIGNGIRQIVILGSGFDMRPLVFETEGVRFCDVDQPAVLAFKGKVLESHGVTPCAGIPCNYLEVDPAEQPDSLVQDRLRLLRQERHRPHHRRRAHHRHHRRVREHPEGEMVDRFRRFVRCRGAHRPEGGRVR